MLGQHEVAEGRFMINEELSPLIYASLLSIAGYALPTIAFNWLREKGYIRNNNRNGYDDFLRR